jgi:hypothetical protein
MGRFTRDTQAHEGRPVHRRSAFPRYEQGKKWGDSGTEW